MPNNRPNVFPTGVGMNRRAGQAPAGQPGVPHRRGDEPDWGMVTVFAAGCSPQAWG